MNPTRLLLLSGASVVGQNILSVISNAREEFRLATINSVATDPPLFDFDEVHLSGNLRDDPEAFARLVADVLTAFDPHLVIPCRDDDVAFLARLGESHPHMSARFLCGASALAEAMLDKVASWSFSQGHDLPFVPTISTAVPASSVAAFAAAQGFPLLAKPSQGFASRGVFLVLDETQLEKVVGRPDYVLQRYIGDPQPVFAYARHIAAEGTPLFHSLEAVKLSIQTFVAPDGATAGVFATRNTMRQGRSDHVARDDDPELKALGARCADVFSVQGWRGPLNIQCQRTPAGDLLIYEYNGRFTGATAARYLMGHDEVGIALETFCGLRWGAFRSFDGKFPAEVVRVPASRAARPGDVKDLMQTGHWRRQ